MAAVCLRHLQHGNGHIALPDGVVDGGGDLARRRDITRRFYAQSADACLRAQA